MLIASKPHNKFGIIMMYIFRVNYYNFAFQNLFFQSKSVHLSVCLNERKKIMSSYSNNLVQQKLAEVKRSLPSYVAERMNTNDNAVKESNRTVSTGNNTASNDFASVLNIETSNINSGSIKSPAEYESIINDVSKKYNISTKVINAVIKAESSFNPDSVSSAGAMGLMQLMPATAKGLGVSNPMDPAQNIEGGVKYLNYQLKRFDGNLEYALAAYNAGPGAVIKYGGVPPYKETQAYVKKIMDMVNS